MSTWYVTYSDGDLMHHGVKGMRWGVRHDPIPSGKPAFGQSYNKSGSSNGVRKTGSSGSIAKGGTGYSSAASKSGTSSAVRKTGNSNTLIPRRSTSGGSYMPSTIFKNGSSSNDRGSWAEFLAVNRPSKVGDNAPTGYFTPAGTAAIVGGATLKDMQEAEEILRRFAEDGKDPSEEEVEFISNLMDAIAKGNKSEYERMMRENPYVSKVLSRSAPNQTSTPNRGGWNKSPSVSNYQRSATPSNRGGFSKTPASGSADNQHSYTTTTRDSFSKKQKDVRHWKINSQSDTGRHSGGGRVRF